MNIVSKKIEDLKPYKNNPRKHPEKSVEFVANSIKEFGFKVPILIDKNNEIIAGHTRLLASQKLGLEKVPCIVVDDLTPEQVKAFRIADNKVSEFSEWDDDLLMAELDGLDDIFTGFDEVISGSGIDQKEDGDIGFTEVLGEEHNYIVLYFDNEVDWLQAETLFDLKPVKALSTRKDGKVKNGVSRVGVGRVLKGREAIDTLLRGGR